ncbi:MAG: hypothetical protein M1820_001510 [Bogoriella megaspora]|nr:MAG: hypothetical protein M1820_001510 [Bogoriella megaspora]
MASLTTTFTPPATCLQPTYTLSPIGKDSTRYSQYSLFGTSSITVFERGIVTECYPPGPALATSLSTDGIDVYTAALTYSPGLMCPAGYYTAEQQTIPIDSSSTRYSAICCPFPTPTVTPFRSTYSVSSSLSSSASPTPTPSNTAATLSTGAKAGIGTGIAIAGIAAILLGWVVRLRIRKGRKSVNKDDFPQTELHGESLGKPRVRVAELDDVGAISEVEEVRIIRELDTQGMRAELAGSNMISSQAK